MNTAIILAAGLGSRLSSISNGKPKGFTTINNQTLIERSIKQLKSVGISRILIGTGHQAHYYDSLLDNQDISCIKNERFASTGSFQTLINMNNHIKDDFLLLESDLLYEKRALTTLIESTKKSVILASGTTNSNDEVFIEADENNFLVDLSKNREELSSVYGELVGISKVSLSTFKELYKWANNNKKMAISLDYEKAFTKIFSSVKIYVEKINDLIWTEIDTQEHYDRAIKLIYPELLKIADEKTS